MTTTRNGWGWVAVVVAALLAWGGAGSVWAAPYTWDSTSGGNWDDTSATGWNAGGYPNLQDDTATFSQDITANQTITINVADARVGTLTLTDATTANYGWDLSGANALTFDSSSGTGSVYVNGSGSYDANTHRISAPIVTGNQLDFIVGASGRIRLSGNNSGATGGMTISGGGSGGFVLFDSAASLGGVGNTITVANGAQAGLGFHATQADLNRFAGSSGLLAFASLLDHGWGYNFSTPASPAPNLDLTGFNEYVRIGAWIASAAGASTTISGTFTPPSNTFRFGGGGGRLTVNSVLADGAAARALEISGTERMLGTVSLVALTEANTYTGPTEVRNGVLRLAGTSGSALNTAAFNVRPGAFLQLDAGLRHFGWEPESGPVVGNNNNRVADTTAVNLYGGALNFFGNPDTGTTETIGALNAQAGLAKLDARWKTGAIYYDTSSVLLTDRGGAGTGAAVLTVQSLSLNNGAQLMLRGVNVGVAGSSATRVMFNAVPTMVGGGGGAGSTTISIIPGVWKSAGLSISQNSGQNQWETYDASVGLRGLSDASSEYSTLVVGENSDNNAKYQQTGAAGTLNISSATTVNSLKIQNDATSGNTIISGTGPLMLKSGNLLVEGNCQDGNNFALSVPIDSNGKAGNVFWFTDSFTGQALNSAMSNTGGNGVNFAAFNTGSYMPAISIGGNNTYTGPSSINAGYWNTSAGERIPNTSDLRVSTGAQLTIGNGFTETVASLSGAGTVTLGNTSSKLILGSGAGLAGAVTLEGASAYIAPGDGTNSAGTLTLSGLSAFDGVRLRSGELRIDLESALDGDVLSVGATTVFISGGGYAGSTLVLNLGYAAEAGDVFKIVDVSGPRQIVGKFSNGDSVNAPYGGKQYRFDILYNSYLGGGDGNDVVLRCTTGTKAGTGAVLVIR